MAHDELVASVRRLVNDMNQSYPRHAFELRNSPSPFYTKLCEEPVDGETMPRHVFSILYDAKQTASTTIDSKLNRLYPLHTLQTEPRFEHQVSPSEPR